MNKRTNNGKFDCGRSSGSGYMFYAGVGSGDGWHAGGCSISGKGYGLHTRMDSEAGIGNTEGHTGFNYSGCGTGFGINPGSGSGVFSGKGYGSGDSFTYSKHDGTGEEHCFDHCYGKKELLIV